MLYVQVTPSKNKPSVDIRRGKGMEKKKKTQPKPTAYIIGDYGIVWKSCVKIKKKKKTQILEKASITVL